MNPAVTLANYSLKRISLIDAAGYILFQVSGASAVLLLLKFFFQDYLGHPLIYYIVTKPGNSGVSVAAISEFLIPFMLF